MRYGHYELQSICDELVSDDNIYNRPNRNCIEITFACGVNRIYNSKVARVEKEEGVGLPNSEVKTSQTRKL